MLVMPGLGPGIHVFLAMFPQQRRGCRAFARHDEYDRPHSQPENALAREDQSCSLTCRAGSMLTALEWTRVHVKGCLDILRPSRQ
jgi:hypothetical protein